MATRSIPPSLALIVVGVAVTAAAAQVQPSRRESDAMKQKIAAILAFGDGSGKQGRRTTLTESEVNSYLRYEVAGGLPPGVVDPSVSALGPGRVSGRAVVDLDAVRKANNGGSLLDLRSYLTGQLPVTATGLLRTGNGVGRFELESATVGGVPIPKWLLQEIITYYSRSADDPDGVGLDDEFELPARIREIQVQRGHAIVVQ